MLTCHMGYEFIRACWILVHTRLIVIYDIHLLQQYLVCVVLFCDINFCGTVNLRLVVQKIQNAKLQKYHVT